MLVPSIQILAFGAIVMATLAAADYYIWGTTWARDFRAPRRVRPLAAAELVEAALEGVIETNAGMLPRSVIESACNKTATAHDDAGFKKVA